MTEAKKVISLGVFSKLFFIILQADTHSWRDTSPGKYLVFYNASTIYEVSFKIHETQCLFFIPCWN